VSNKVVTVADLPDKFRQLTIADTGKAGGALKQPDQAGLASMPVSSKHDEMEFGEGGIDLNTMVSSLERNMIMQALKKAGGVRSKAAQLLKLNRTTLLEKMKKMDIETQKM
jgi:DNA-binding NtrC family response regulator